MGNMKFLTNDECSAWTETLGVDQIFFDAMPDPNGIVPGEVDVAFEDSDQPKVNLAQTFASWIGPFEGCLLWIKEYGIWPSFENRHLFRRLRLSYGETREIQDAPGHLFSVQEYEDLVSYLDLALQFGWGGYLIASPLSCLIFVSHDGWLRVHSDNHRELLEQVRSRGLPFEEG
jgi:hypothetical protein